MLIVDAAGSVALANPAEKALFGYPDQEFGGLPVDSLVPSRLRGRHRSHRTDYGATPRKRMLAAGGDLYGLRKDGSEFAADIGLSPMDEGMVLVTIQDVTARRRMEKALTLFSRVVEQTASTVVISDADGVIEYVNPRFVETTGYTAAEAAWRHGDAWRLRLLDVLRRHRALVLERVADGLRDPVDLAFAPDGAAFVAERGGRVRVIRDDVLGPAVGLWRSWERA